MTAGHVSENGLLTLTKINATFSNSRLFPEALISYKKVVWPFLNASFAAISTAAIYLFILLIKVYLFTATIYNIAI